MPVADGQLAVGNVGLTHVVRCGDERGGVARLEAPRQQRRPFGQRRVDNEQRRVRDDEHRGEGDHAPLPTSSSHSVTLSERSESKDLV